MSSMKITFIILLTLTFAFGQDLIISGIVADSSTDIKLSNVNIFLKGKNKGSSTDEYGMFLLKIDDKHKKDIIVFEHVGYKTFEISVESAVNIKKFLLKPIIMETEPIGIQDERYSPDIKKDIEIPISIIDNKRFDVQGYVDIGDLLKTDRSIQIEEKISGEKNISMRAGNPDDVVILYDGIKMNNIFDNTFNLAFIDMEDIESVEVIKGSNTALYGSGAFSGIVNIIPKTNSDYFIKFQQKFGTYNTGKWNLQLNHKFFNRTNLNYSVKKSGSKRKYADSISKSDFLQNKSEHHQAGLLYSFDENNFESNNLSIIYLNQRLSHKNFRNNEDQQNRNEIITVNYKGDIYFKNLKLASSYNRLNTEQTLAIDEGKLSRDFLNQDYSFNFEKQSTYRLMEILLAYQYKYSTLDYTDERNVLYTLPHSAKNPPDLLSSDFTRWSHGIVSIVKFHAPSASEFFNPLDISVSYRYDDVQNRRNNFNATDYLNPFEVHNTHNWKNSTIKFSSALSGQKDNLEFNGFLNFGTNIKFPSLFQQISTPASLFSKTDSVFSIIKPEEVQGLEVGCEFTKKINSIDIIDYWQTNLSYFKNAYTHKFVTLPASDSPVSFFYNIGTAEISGFDLQAKLAWFGKKLFIQPATCFYNVSDVLAFPFKYKSKTTFNVIIDYYGFYAQFHWFNEGEQTGMVRTTSNKFETVNLPRHSNIDIHIKKTFQIMKSKFFTNLSVRNLLDDETAIEGIAIRDRRIYLTFGVEY